MKIARALLLAALYGVAACGQLRFATEDSLEVISEDATHEVAAVAIVGDADAGGETWRREYVQLMISCSHGTLHVKNDVRNALADTTFLCVPDQDGVQPQRVIEAHTTVGEARQVLASLIYQPDENYHANWVGVTDSHCDGNKDDMEVIWMTLTPAESHSAPRETCSAPPSDASSLYSTTTSVHRKKISISSMNDPPTIDRDGESVLSVDAAGACVKLTGFRLDDVEASALESDLSAAVPILSLTLGVQSGSLRVNRRRLLENAVRITDSSGEVTDISTLAWTLPDLKDSSLVAEGAISRLNDALPSIEYCSPSDGKVLSDTLELILSDNGVCGGEHKQSLSASLSVPVDIHPVVDLGSLSTIHENVTLLDHFTLVDVKYLPGESVEVDCFIDLQHDDGTFLSIDDAQKVLLYEPAEQATSTRTFPSENALPSRALVITFGDNNGEVGEQTGSFKLVRSVCDSANDCRTMESGLLLEDFSDVRIVAAFQELVVAGESVSELKVVRYSASRDWVLWNLPEGLLYDVAILTQSHVSMRKMGRHLHTKGESKLIAAQLDTLAVYSLAGGVWGHNSLNVTLVPALSKTGTLQPVLSLQLDLFVVPIYKDIDMAYPLELVLGTGTETSLSGISLVYPPTYSASTVLKWSIHSTLGFIWWDPSSVSSSVISQQTSGKELALRGSLADLNVAIASTYIDESAAQSNNSLFSEFVEGQVFELLALPPYKPTSAQTLATAQAVGTVSGDFTLGVELPGRYYASLSLDVGTGQCTSVAIDTADDVDTIAAKIAEMPCTVAPSGELGDATRQEVQVIRVAALYPAHLDELDGTFQVTFGGQSTAPISVTSSIDTLTSAILEVVVDAEGIEVSRTDLSDEDMFQWEITFATAGDVKEVFEIVYDETSAPFSVSAFVEVEGLGPADLRLDAFFLGLSLSVQQTKAVESGSYALELSFMNVPDDFPVLEVMETSLASAETAELLSVTVETSTTTVFSGVTNSDVFQLRVGNQVTSAVTVNAPASTVEASLRALGVSRLQAYVQRRASLSVPNRFDYVVTISAPTVLTLALESRENTPLSGTHFRIAHVNRGTNQMTAFDTISMSVSTTDNSVSLGSAELTARITKRPQRLGIGLPVSYLSIAVSESLRIDGIRLQGYAREVRLTISSNKGRVSLSPKMPKSSFSSSNSTPQSSIEISGHISQLQDTFEQSVLVYTPDTRSSGYDELALFLESPTSQADEILPIRILAPAKPPTLILPVRSLSVFKNALAEIDGISVSVEERVGLLQRSFNQVVGIAIKAQRGTLMLPSDLVDRRGGFTTSPREKSEIRVESAVENLNAALRGLLYRAPASNTPKEDQVTFSAYLVGGNTDFPPAQETAELLIRIEERPLIFSVALNGSVIRDSSLLATTMNAPASLEGMAIQVGSDFGIDDCGASSALSSGPSSICNLTIELTVFALHGLIVDRGESIAHYDSSASAAHAILAPFIGTAEQASYFLRRQLYVPASKFHGPDQVLIKVTYPTKMNPESDEMDEMTAVLPVFVAPACEAPRLYWASTGTNETRVQRVDPSSFAIPKLLLSRKGLDAGYCNDDTPFRAVLQADNGVISSNSAQRTSSPAGQSMLHLEGRLYELNRAFDSVKHEFAKRQYATTVEILVHVQEVSTSDEFDAVTLSSARLRVSFVGDNSPPPLFTQAAIISSEDEDVPIGHLVDMQSLAEADPDSIFEIAAQNGGIYAVADGVRMLPSRNTHQFMMKEVSDLRALTLQMRYTPTLNFNGIDQIDFKLGEQQSTLFVKVQPANDAPELVVNFEELQDWYKDPLMFLPSFQIRDPDTDDTFQVDLRVSNGSIRLENELGESFDGITVEMSPSARSSRLISTLGRLNKLFQQRLIEVLPESCSDPQGGLALCAGLVDLCVGDGTSNVCDELVFPAQTPFYRAVVSEWTRHLDLLAGRSLDISNAFRLYQRFDVRSDFMMRLSVSSGDIQVDVPSCGNLREASSGSEMGGMIQLVYASSIECLNEALGSATYRSLAAVAGTTLVELELFDGEMRMCSNASFQIQIAEVKPSKLLNVAKVGNNELWHTTRNNYVGLPTLVNASIMKESTPETVEVGDEVVLNLEISCINCQWHYSAYVPSVSYEFAALPSSKLGFLGQSTALNKVFESLQLTIDSSKVSGTETISIALARTAVDNTAAIKPELRETTNISVPFTIDPAPLEWETTGDSLVAQPINYTVDLHNVRLIGREDAPRANVTIRLQCLAGEAAVSILQVGSPLLDVPCSPEVGPMEFSVNREQVSKALSSTLVSLNQAGKGLRTDLQLSAFTTDSEAASEAAVTVLQLRRSSQHEKPRLSVRAFGEALQASEGGIQSLGDLLIAEGVPGDETWFSLRLRVSHGRLSVPAHICCVEIRNGDEGKMINVVGTTGAIMNAITATEYATEAQFAGEDELEITIAPYDSESGIASTFGSIPIAVAAVNQPPTILHRQHPDLDTSAVFSEEQIEISDVDLVRFAATAAAPFVVDISSVTGSFLLDDSAKRQVRILEIQESADGCTKVSFEAPLRDANVLLARVLYTPHDTTADCIENNEILVAVSDQGNGMDGWDEKRAVAALPVFDCNRNQRPPRLEVPKNHTTFDESEGSLSLVGLSVLDSDHRFSQGSFDMLELDATVNFRMNLEVQQVRLVAPKQQQLLVISIHVPEGNPPDISGTFSLQVDSNFAGVRETRTVRIYADAVAMISDETYEELNNGRAESESIEAQLMALYGMAGSSTKRFYVVKHVTTSPSVAVIWSVFVTESQIPLEPPTVLDSSLLGPATGIEVSIEESRAVGPLGGVFQLQLYEEVTAALPFDATGEAVQDALEALDAIGVVKVEKMDGTTWEITFMSPAENVPLLVGDSRNLQPIATRSDNAANETILEGAFLAVERISVGAGQGNLYEISVGATLVDRVYTLTTGADSTITGDFVLGFQEVIDGTPFRVLASTNTIAFDALAMADDEGILQNLGGRQGESVQSKLKQALSTVCEQLPRHCSVPIEVVRGEPSAEGGLEWVITFHRAPSDFPSLMIYDQSGLNGDNVMVNLVQTQSSNQAQGQFALSYRSFLTEPIAVGARASVIESALNGLASVHSSIHGVGQVIARRARHTTQYKDGFHYVILFVEYFSTPSRDLSIENDLLVADGSLMIGLGAFAHARALHVLNPGGDFEIPVLNGLVGGWARELKSTFDRNTFTLEGYSNDIDVAIKHVVYRIAEGWFGNVRVLLALRTSSKPGLRSDVSAEVIHSATTDEVQSTYRLPSLVVQRNTLATIIEVDAGVPLSLGEFSIQGHGLYISTMWVSLRITAEDGGLRPDRMGSSAHGQMLWINGTIPTVNAQLAYATYTAELQSPRYSSLKFAVVAKDSVRSESTFTTIVKLAPPLPLIHVKGSLEGPFQTDQWEIVQLKLNAGESSRLPGVFINDSSGRSQLTDDLLTLRADADFGAIDFGVLDGLDVHYPRRNRPESAVVLVGPMNMLNAALESCRYRCEEACEPRDIITLNVENPRVGPFGFRHERKLSIELQFEMPLPRVVLSSSLYSSTEDAAFQFPDISLKFEDVVSTQQSAASAETRQLTQLWATELRYPTTKYDYPRSSADDARHRWVASFVGSGLPHSFCAMDGFFYFAGHDATHGEELWVSDGSAIGTRMLVDLVPGLEGSMPTDLVTLNGQLFFTASGIDLGWALSARLSCNAARMSTINSSLLYVVSKSNTWNPAKSYDCPSGLHWASTSEVSELLVPPHGPSNQSEPYVFWDNCEWDGYDFGGVTRKYFRFSDSNVTGAFKHAGRQESAPVEFSFVTTEFAGIICIRSGLDMRASGPGRELWATDGHAEQTHRVADLRPGPKSSNPRYYTPFRSQWLLFQAETDEFGSELFKTDGTEAGTIMVEDIWRGPRSSHPSYFAEWTAGDGNTRMYFAATTDSGRELWVTDAFSSFTTERGRKASASSGAVGTVMVQDICSGAQSSEPRFLVAVDSVGVFFSATDCIHGRELWITDGSRDGTRMVKDLATEAGEGSDPSNFVEHDGMLYFQAQADLTTTGRELYVSDGSEPGTRLLVDLVAGSGSSAPDLLSVVGAATNSQRLYFIASDSNSKRNLWKSDGTEQNTELVLDEIFLLEHNLAFGTTPPAGQIEHLLEFDNALYFITRGTSRGSTATYEKSVATLHVNVSSGSIAISNRTNGIDKSMPPVLLGSSATLTLRDSYHNLARSLERLVYFPPQNWNVEKSPGMHIVEWQFSISYENRSVETYADLVVRPRVDAPVIIVPEALEDTAHYMGDYLSFLRVECLPLICDEDMAVSLEGFSVRAADALKTGKQGAPLLTTTLSVSHGVLTLSNTNCISRFVTVQTPRHIAFRADVECINKVLTETAYTSEPNFSGADQLVLRVAYSQDPEYSFDEVTVPIIVVELNDAPYIDAPSVFYDAEEDIPLVIADLQLRDPDAEDTTLQLVVETTYGSLALLRSNGVELTSEIVLRSTGEATRLTLKGTLENLNAAITSVVYTSARNWNSLQLHLYDGVDATSDGFDRITIKASDFSDFNGSTVSVLYVYVLPTPDPVLINAPSNVPTSIYVNDAPGSLRGDEDTWIYAYGLTFSSEDDTSRSTLVVSLMVAHGTLTLSSLTGITFLEHTTNAANHAKFKGTFANVNRCVTGLRYLPEKDFFGSDDLVVTTSAVDEYSLQETPTTVLSVSIVVDPVNDAPVWSIGSSTTREIRQGMPSKIMGVSFQDVDTVTLDCAVVSCEMDVIITASHGFVTLPRLSQRDFAADMTTEKSTYVVVSGTPQELNMALLEMVFELDDAEHYRADIPGRTDIKLQLTVDDRGTFGSGGPQVSTTNVLFNPVVWAAHEVTIVAPPDVLTLAEDTAFVFGGELYLEDPDTARSFQSLLELTISCTNGSFALSRVTTGIQVLRNVSDEALVVRGFLAQLNAALNGSAYIPSKDWYGAEHILLSIIELSPEQIKSPTTISTTADIFLFVSPVCDEPHWDTQPSTGRGFTMEEDAYLLIDTLSLTNPDLDDEQREVEVAITVPHGGVMLSSMKGLLVQQSAYSIPADDLVAQHFPPGRIFTESRLFFSNLVARGRISDVNSALEGMIYKPWPNYNSKNLPSDEIELAATSVCGGAIDIGVAPSASITTVPITINAVNDPPTLVTRQFHQVSLSYSLSDLESLAMSSAIEAVEDSPQLLAPVELYDLDYELSGGDLRLLVNISCVHCTVTSNRLSGFLASTVDDERRVGDDLIFVSNNWSKQTGVQLVVHGNLPSLNEGLLSDLVFQGERNFYGLAFVLLEVSDLGNYGKGGEQRAAFALPVHVKATNDGPQIHLPPYERIEPVLQVDESASVFIRGAPTLAQVAAVARDKSSITPVWDLMLVNVHGNDSSTRLQRLHQFPSSEATAASFLVAHSSGLIFSGRDATFGQELWRSDGTAAGTMLLKDIFPGKGGSCPAHLTPFSKDSRVYFAATGPHVSWRIRRDYQDSCRSFRQSSFNPDVFFVVAEHNEWDPDETYDCPLGFHWMSTLEAGAVFVGTIPTDGHSDEPLTYFDQCGWQEYDWGGRSRKYFRFADSKTTGAFKHAGHRDSYRLDTGFQTELFAGIVCVRSPTALEPAWGSQLWATDGTADGTRRVARISPAPEGSAPSHFVEFQERLYFQASSPDYGAELWTTDGTRTGTFLVADIEFGTQSSTPRFLTALDDHFFFSATTQANGRELWFSDGDSRFDFTGDQHAAVGTGLLLDICVGPDSANPQHLVALMSSSAPHKLLFQADDCVHGAELWVTDGTRVGTLLVADIRDGPLGSSPSYLTQFGDQVFFQADDGIHGAELWVTDGSLTGTKMLIDLASGVVGSKPSFLTVLSSVHSTASVLGFVAQSDRDRLITFWTSDGTDTGTMKLFPKSHEVAWLNTESMDMQLAGHSLVSTTSQSAGFFYLGRENAQGLDFHQLAAERSSEARNRDSVLTRSITLEDVEAARHNRELILSLSCSKGWLSLGRQCTGLLSSGDGSNGEMSSAFTLRGSLDALNCAVEKLTYHAKPQMDGRDEIVVSLEETQQVVSADTSTALAVTTDNDDGEQDSSYAVTKRILVHVRAINDPPVVRMATRYFAPRGQWVALRGIEISDPDSADNLLYLRLSVHSGRLRAPLALQTYGRGLSALHTVVDEDSLRTLEFATKVDQAVEVLTALEYSCHASHGCVDDRRDYLTVYVDDNGFTGAHGPQVAVQSAEILILDDVVP